MGMRNNSGIPSIIFFILFIGIVSGPVSFVFGLFPLIIPALIIFGIVKAATNDNRNKNIKSVRKKTTNTGSNAKAFVSARDKGMIDRRLKEYFKDHYALPVFEDIKLVTKNGTYTSFEELYIAKGDETILSLDEFGNMFPGTYSEIVSLLKAFSKQKKDDVMAAEDKMPEVKKEDKLSDAEKYIEKINSLNVAIPQEEITNGLYQTCALLKQIDIATKANAKDSKIEKLYDYYLPILLKILENYRSLMEAGAKGDEFKKCEAQLIKTIILINEALKSINESMHEDDYMNLNADITTLQSLLKKDGLVKEGSIFEGDDDE